MANAELPKLYRVCGAIARVTFFEIIRDKILYNSIIISVLLLGVSFLAGSLSFFRPERIVLNFGLSAVNLSLTFIAILLGSNLLLKEFERRTIFVALSKPITRFQFLLGKYLGLALVLLVNWALLAVCYLAILVVSGGAISPILLTALVMVYFQSLLAGALSVLFSSFSTASLSITLTVGVFLIGVNLSQMLLVAQKSESAFAKMALTAIARVVPNFEKFSLGTKVTYDLPLEPGQLLFVALYGTLTVALYLVIAGFFIQKREN